jgi:hypothetical protein
MLAHRPLEDRDLATPEYAIRTLLADLDADRPYVVTHGSVRRVYTRRRDEMDAAIDRMERSEGSE